MKQSVTLSQSYRHVRRISRRSGSSFYRSFWLLPSEKRSAMCALYAFARITDDLGDCDEPPALRTRWLDWWRRTTALNLIGDPNDGRVLLADELVPPYRESRNGMGKNKCHLPVDLHRCAREILPALSDTSRRYNIPSRYMLEIIDGVLADQQKTRFDTYEQVEHYCYLVASAVGLACLHIWEFDEPLPEAAAIDCGLAFQWTNILRDISEDAGRGRIYLPRQHYEMHELSEDDLLSPRPDDRLCCLIAEEAERAKKLFDSGWNIWDSLHADGKPMFSMMWRTYRKLLQRIADDPGSVLVRRVRLTTSEKLGLVSRHFVPPIFRRLPVPPIEVSQSSGDANGFPQA
ncbi:squalene/phytoene synthase family protein [Rubripirellula amarantea]|uniref:All-trans-phytoene synthase n=1 Tax=Rubripirellula amarantea TaxID=2527999 RepID=A0A5C5WSG8_9BACT|nr:phytoene/squalene synthase family protein [Rubripirellula amarantea]MDA8744550.1 squalene/phytoene synthase family protein [Rubripirellula amarantea]TWT53085.1 All-trans-phytoene synthase [Rubripirellula amarantea]